MSDRGRGKATAVLMGLFVLVPVLLFSCFFLSVWPMDGDETMRLDETVSFVQGHIPFYDTLMVVTYPGFWLLLAPVVLAVPVYWLPLAARFFSLVLFLAALVALFPIQNGRSRSGGHAPALLSIGLLLLNPEMLYKVAECIPDAFAAGAILFGGALFLLSDSTRDRLFGIVLSGIGMAVKLDYAVAVVPMLAGWFFRHRSEKDPARWAWGLLIPGLIVILVFVILAGRRASDLILDIPLLATLARIGKGSTTGQLSMTATFSLTLIAVLATLDLVRQIARPDKEGRLAFSVFAYGTALLSFAFHMVMGARFLQNYWMPAYFFAPLAGSFLARSPVIARAGRGNFLSDFRLAALVSLCAILAVFVPVKDRLLSAHAGNRESKMSAWRDFILSGEEAHASGKSEFEAYEEISAGRLAGFQRYVHDSYGNDFTMYSNDFRILFGTQLPPRAVAKVATLLRVNQNVRQSPEGRRLLEILRSRFKPAMFVKNGLSLAPGEYFLEWKPDLLVADDMLLRLALAEPRLRRMLATDYRLTWADESVLVFEKTRPAAPVPEQSKSSE